MKKLFAVLLASAVLASPFAASAQDYRPHKPRHSVTTEREIIRKKPNGAVVKRTIVQERRWQRGGKLTRAERRQIVNERDWRRHNLRRPGNGQQWVRVNNQYLLISAATGLIVGLSVAR